MKGLQIYGSVSACVMKLETLGGGACLYGWVWVGGYKTISLENLILGTGRWFTINYLRIILSSSVCVYLCFLLSIGRCWRFVFVCRGTLSSPGVKTEAGVFSRGSLAVVVLVLHCWQEPHMPLCSDWQLNTRGLDSRYDKTLSSFPLRSRHDPMLLLFQNKHGLMLCLDTFYHMVLQLITQCNLWCSGWPYHSNSIPVWIPSWPGSPCVCVATVVSSHSLKAWG